MNENNILDVFYKMLDENKFDDIDKFETVDKAHNFIDNLYKRYRIVYQNNEIYKDTILKDSANIEEIEDIEMKLLQLKNQCQQMNKLRDLIDGAFFDIQEFYFIQGFKASMELREQLKRLLDNKSM